MLDDVHSESPTTRDDLRRLTPLSVREDIPPPERPWSEQDWLRICRGHNSTDMEDKWDAFVEGQRLYFHRSWTGMGVYEAEFVQVADGWQLCCAVVEGDSRIYRRQDDAYESALLEALIDGKL